MFRGLFFQKILLSLNCLGAVACPVHRHCELNNLTGKSLASRHHLFSAFPSFSYLGDIAPDASPSLATTYDSDSECQDTLFKRTEEDPPPSPDERKERRQ